MKNLAIKPTKFTPQVLFDTESNTYFIEGESVPEFAAEFYKPIIQWLKDYEGVLFYMKKEFLKTPAFELNLKYTYFNSTSAKFILDIMFVISRYNNNDIDACVNWHYKLSDVDAKEAGEEFAELCKGLRINFKSY
jgi:hypothetical protein